jgi:hypothetical protein
MKQTKLKTVKWVLASLALAALSPLFIGCDISDAAWTDDAAGASETIECTLLLANAEPEAAYLAEVYGPDDSLAAEAEAAADGSGTARFVLNLAPDVLYKLKAAELTGSLAEPAEPLEAALQFSASKREETVSLPERRISLSVIRLNVTRSYTFPAVTLPDYKVTDPLTVTVTNEADSPTGALTVTLSDDAAFSLDRTAIDGIEAGGSAEFTVAPRAGLAEGKYTATVTVASADSGLSDGLSAEDDISAGFGVNITVSAPDTPAFADVLTHLPSITDSSFVTYTLTGGTEDYSGSVTLTRKNSPEGIVIDGGGRTIFNTKGANRVTVGSGVSLTLRNITFIGIPFTAAAGGRLVLDTGAVLTGNVNISAVLVETGGALDMKDGAIRDNIGGTPGAVGDGPAIPAGGGVLVDGGVFTMSGGRISGNIAGGGYSHDIGSGYIISGSSGAGGGVFVRGESGVFTMSGGVIGGDTEADANKAGPGGNLSAYYTGGGGVLAANGGRFIMTGAALVKGNVSGASGGGVHVYNGFFSMLGGEVANNASNTSANSSHRGGGVYRTEPIPGNPYGERYIEGSVDGNPWVGAYKSNGAGPGWIHGNTPDDIAN